jgi:hypothetical protein
MANRILAGNRTAGGYGLYVSRPGNDVLTCASDKMAFSTNHDETGGNFISAGYFLTVPVSGGVGADPVISSENVIAAGATENPTYQSYASSTVMVWGSKASIPTAGQIRDQGDNFYGYGTPTSTTVAITNSGDLSTTVRSVTFNMLSGLNLF